MQFNHHCKNCESLLTEKLSHPTVYHNAGSTLAALTSTTSSHTLSRAPRTLPWSWGQVNSSWIAVCWSLPTMVYQAVLFQVSSSLMFVRTSLCLVVLCHHPHLHFHLQLPDLCSTPQWREDWSHCRCATKVDLWSVGLSGIIWVGKTVHFPSTFGWFCFKATRTNESHTWSGCIHGRWTGPSGFTIDLPKQRVPVV